MTNKEMQDRMDRFRLAIYLLLDSAIAAKAFTQTEAEALDLAILTIARQAFLDEDHEKAQDDELTNGAELLKRAVELHKREHVQKHFETGPHLN